MPNTAAPMRSSDTPRSSFTHLLIGLSMACLSSSSALADGPRDYEENFHDVDHLPGWKIVNTSADPGPFAWRQGNPARFHAQSGPNNSFVSTDYGAGAGGAVSVWLISPVIDFTKVEQFSFWTRSISGVPGQDRLEVRLSSNGASTNVGSSPSTFGDFNRVLQRINWEFDRSYPTEWRKYEIAGCTVSSCPFPTTEGRIAFRYQLPSSSIEYGAYLGLDGVRFQGWGERLADTSTFQDQYRPSIAAADNTYGDTVVAWDGFDVGDGDSGGIFAARFDHSGAPIGGRFQVNLATAGDQKAPQVVMAPWGAFAILWLDRERQIRVRYFDSGGTPGSEYALFSTDSPCWLRNLTATLLPLGPDDPTSVGVLFAYDSFCPGEDIHARIGVTYWNSDNTRFKNLPSNGDLAHFPQAAATGPNSLIVTYSNKVHGITEVRIARYTLPGFLRPSAATYEILWSGDPSIPPRTALAATGNTVAVVTTFGESHSSLQFLYPDGSDTTLYNGCCLSEPSLTTQDGDFYLAWTGNDSHQGGVFYRRFATNGTAIGPAKQLNFHEPRGQFQPMIVGSDGQLAAAWTSIGQEDGHLEARIVTTSLPVENLPAAIFSDGFESRNLSRWSSATR